MRRQLYSLGSTRDFCRAMTMFRPASSIIRSASARPPSLLQPCRSQWKRTFYRSSVRRDEQAHEQPHEQSSYQAKRSASLTPLMMLLGITPIVTFALGTWQIHRLQWKVDLIDDLQEKLQRAPMELPNFVKYLHSLRSSCRY